MFFIGVITDKNSENNIKNILKDRLAENEIVFLNNSNLENFKNVKFDSIVVNSEIEDKLTLDKLLGNSKYVLYNSDIDMKRYITKKAYNNPISYGYNSKALVTISSVTDENFLIFIQDEIKGYNKTIGMQEIIFEKNSSNINVYDGMIAITIDIIYST